MYATGLYKMFNDADLSSKGVGLLQRQLTSAPTDQFELIYEGQPIYIWGRITKGVAPFVHVAFLGRYSSPDNLIAVDTPGSLRPIWKVGDKVVLKCAFVGAPGLTQGISDAYSTQGYVVATFRQLLPQESLSASFEGSADGWPGCPSN